jgi:hypothetical protein
MKALATWATWAFVVLVVGACATPQERYFSEHVNEVSLDAVAKRFGPPHHQQALTTGETVWSYEYRDGPNCTAYILTFDQVKVLRGWKRQRC